MLCAGQTEGMKSLHPSYVRLCEVAKEVGGCNTDSEIAVALDDVQQTVHNWQRRGVSKQGALKAEARFRCRASWILDGNEPKMVVDYTAPRPALDQRVQEDKFVDYGKAARLSSMIEQLADAIKDLPGTRWESVRSQLDILAKEPDKRDAAVEELRLLLGATVWDEITDRRTGQVDRRNPTASKETARKFAT